MSVDYFERGMFEYEHGNFEIAAEHFSKNIANEGQDNFEALKSRSSCYQELGHYQKAFDDGDKIVQMHPKSTCGYALCGRALSKLDKFEDALITFRKGLAIDANDLEIKNGLKDLQTDIVDSFERKSSEKTYDAVELCSQAQYPGDNELETMEREIMDKWGMTEFPDMTFAVQDQQKALKEYQTALQLRKAGNDQQAQDKLRSALTYDTTNFMLRGEMALLLYDMDRYKEAFQHCQCIPTDFRQGTHWKLGGKILDALDLPVHAESWLRHGCKVDKKDKEMPLMFQNIRVKRLYGPLTLGSKVGVVFTEFGRAIQATDDMSTGDNCFRDKPAILAQTLDTMQVTACQQCAKSLMRAEDYFGKELLLQNGDLRKMVIRYWPNRARIGCKKCGDKVVYCSEDCRDEAWSTYHRVLCVSENPTVEKLNDVCSQYATLSSDSRCWKGMWNASFSPYVIAKMWASIICMANNLAIQNGRTVPSSDDWTMAKSPYRKFIAYGAASNATAIPKMVALMQEVFNNADLPEGYRHPINNREFDGRYFQATCNVQAFSDPSPPFNEFMANLSHDPKRDKVREHILKAPDEAMFAGMFPLHACLNHSCDNNVEVLDGHPGVLVRAKKPIKVGDELFTTYINTRMGRKERRAWLYRGYNFWCKCPRCQFEGDGPEKCTQCAKAAKDDAKERYPGCGKCHRAWYCSTVCQKTAWKKGHKKICSTPHSDTTSSADYYMSQIR